MGRPKHILPEYSNSQSSLLLRGSGKPILRPRESRWWAALSRCGSSTALFAVSLAVPTHHAGADSVCSLQPFLFPVLKVL